MSRHYDTSVDGIRTDPKLVYESGKMYEATTYEATKPKSIATVRPIEWGLDGIEVFGFRIPTFAIIIGVVIIVVIMATRKGG